MCGKQNKWSNLYDSSRDANANLKKMKTNVIIIIIINNN